MPWHDGKYAFSSSKSNVWRHISPFCLGLNMIAYATLCYVLLLDVFHRPIVYSACNSWEVIRTNGWVHDLLKLEKALKPECCWYWTVMNLKKSKLKRAWNYTETSNNIFVLGRVMVTWNIDGVLKLLKGEK